MTLRREGLLGGIRLGNIGGIVLLSLTTEAKPTAGVDALGLKVWINADRRVSENGLLIWNTIYTFKTYPGGIPITFGGRSILGTTDEPPSKLSIKCKCQCDKDFLIGHPGGRSVRPTCEISTFIQTNIDTSSGAVPVITFAADCESDHAIDFSRWEYIELGKASSTIASAWNVNSNASGCEKRLERSLNYLTRSLEQARKETRIQWDTGSFYGFVPHDQSNMALSLSVVRPKIFSYLSWWPSWFPTISEMIAP